MSSLEQVPEPISQHLERGEGKGQACVEKDNGSRVGLSVPGLCALASEEIQTRPVSTRTWSRSHMTLGLFAPRDESRSLQRVQPVSQWLDIQLRNRCRVNH